MLSFANARKIFAIFSIFIIVGCSKKITKLDPLPGVEVKQAPTPKPTPEPVKPSQPPYIAQTPAPIVAPVIYFEWDKSELLGTEVDKLQGFAMVTRETLTIEGHADESGSNAYNLALGDRRARVVARYLRDAGLNIGDVVSYGEERPVHFCGCRHPENRRVEIKVN